MGEDSKIAWTDHTSAAEIEAMYRAASRGAVAPDLMMLPGSGRCPICLAVYSFGKDRAECEVSCEHMRAVQERMEFGEA